MIQSNFIDLKNLNVVQIIIIVFLIVFCLLVFCLTFFLVVISNYKNKQNLTLKNLQFIQNLTIKERLKRIQQMVKNNEQYQTILHIWISKYQNYLKKELKEITKNFFKIIQLKSKHRWCQSFKLMNKISYESKELKHQIQLLVTEIDYLISIDQLQREYQLFFKQNFSYLQDESIKIKFQDNINIEQLNEIISIIKEMFKDLNENVNEANFVQVLKILGEIAICIVTLAEILAYLPVLNNLVNYEIVLKMKEIYHQFQLVKDDDVLFVEYILLEKNVTQILDNIKLLISNLQYKKAKKQIFDILKQINSFTFKIKQEQIFATVFKTKYQQFLLINFNFIETFNIMNNKFTEIKAKKELDTNHSLILELQNKIVKELNVFNKIDNELIVESKKKKKSLSYEQLVLLLNDLLKNSLVVFNSLWEYNKLLHQEIKKQIIFETTITKINAVMLQIDNILNNINYYYLLNKYNEEFEILKNSVNNLVLILKNNVILESDILHLYDIENKVFQFYNQLILEIKTHNLVNLTLIYANRYRKINENLKDKFTLIETNINNNNHQIALTALIEIME